MDTTHIADSSRLKLGFLKRLPHALRLGLLWGLIGLPHGMLLGGGAGLVLAWIDNALIGIGGDSCSGPLSRTSQQEFWVYIHRIGFGLLFGGGLFIIVCGLMGCIRGIIDIKSAISMKSGSGSGDFTVEQ